MAKTVTFTFPGKLGDALHQWPVAFWWHRQKQQPFEVWLDETTCKDLVPLIECQPGVAKVELKSGIESYHCGGQPWHFNVDSSEHEERQFIHLGLRAFPQRQLTLQAFHDASVQVEVESIELAETPTLAVPEAPKVNRLVIHGMGVCPHTRQSPGMWRFLAMVRPEIEKQFDEIVFVGLYRDRQVGMMAYQKAGWQEYNHERNWLDLATYVKASRLVIACGSSIAALAGQLKVPCVRVHDPIGEAAKTIWSNLGSNQINATEMELRSEWAEYRDRVLATEGVKV